MRSTCKLQRNLLIFILGPFVLSFFMRISPLAADHLQPAQDSSGEDTEVIANLEFLESLEFLEEEVPLVDDYEALDKWEGEQNE
ncbi:MAG TPA: hypothetical protein DE315_08890 [Candidatus Omnitrophica bacterium]|nr:hypothetical protein [Candidatus Omnitrophota bacterium]HCI45624.1 hypothetical protein [Candidatus Omnitrophota bacterium]